MLAIALCACSDNEDEPNSLLGTWQYEQPHFEFEYAQDSIVISMGQYRKMSIAAKDLKTMFLRKKWEIISKESLFRTIIP